jgi:hypothetical protein
MKDPTKIVHNIMKLENDLNIFESLSAKDLSFFAKKILGPT